MVILKIQTRHAGPVIIVITLAHAQKVQCPNARLSTTKPWKHETEGLYTLTIEKYVRLATTNCYLDTRGMYVTLIDISAYLI